jgi:hypothetical protein
MNTSRKGILPPCIYFLPGCKILVSISILIYFDISPERIISLGSYEKKYSSIIVPCIYLHFHGSQFL